MKIEPTFEDCGWDDEPEFDLHAAYERNKVSYLTSPAFRQMMDQLFGSPQRVAAALARNPYPKQ